MAGNWSGGGTITLDDGSTERIRCRASYAVGANGTGLNQALVCASDSYKFDLRSNVVADHGSLSGTWSETSRGINGSLEGRGSSGNFQVVASAPGFTANSQAMASPAMPFTWPPHRRDMKAPPVACGPPSRTRG